MVPVAREPSSFFTLVATADVVSPALDEDRGGAADFLHNLVNQCEVVVHLRGAKKYGRDALAFHRISAFDFRGS
jgi:hypothetical protein